MDPLTELLTGLGRHYGLVLVGCAELIAALFLLGWRPRERRGRERFTAVSSVDRLMLSELYRQEGRSAWSSAAATGCPSRPSAIWKGSWA